MTNRRKTLGRTATQTMTISSPHRDITQHQHLECIINYYRVVPNDDPATILLDAFKTKHSGPSL